MPTYDVFLSHNSADKAAVEAVAERLRDEAELAPFLDKWHLVPGESWISALEQAIATSKTVAVFFGPRGMSAWQAEEKQLALVHSAQRDEHRVIPVLLPGASTREIEGFLSLRTWVDLADDDGFARLVAGILGQAPELLKGFNPGPDLGRRLSLHARLRREIIDFTTERGRHEHFFGREDIFAEIDAWLDVHDSGWLLITGGPGLGKSALLDQWLRRRSSAGLLTAFHFIRRGQKNWADPKAVQTNLAAQIELMFPAQRDAEAEPAYRLEQLLQRLSPVLAESHQRLVLLVDGLDEAMMLGKDNPIPYIFPLEVPARVFVVTASRPRYPHLGWFEERNGPSYHLDLDTHESNEKAVHEYWSIIGSSMAPPLDTDHMKAAIDSAHGNMLHAVKLRQLWDKPNSTRSIEDVPKGLQGMFRNLWTRIGTLPMAERKLARQGLSLICAARESMPLRVLEELLGWDEADAEDQFLPLTREMLLEEPWYDVPRYRPFHEGLREMLESKLNNSTIEHHGLLANYAAWPTQGDDFRRNYSLMHRIVHLVATERLQDAAKTVMDLEFLSAKACVAGVDAVETDIRFAAEAQTDDHVRDLLLTLARVVAASSHWAREVPEALPGLVRDRALTNAPALCRSLVGVADRLPQYLALRYPLQIRGLSRIHHRHEDELAALPGRRVASVSQDDGSVSVWDIVTGHTLTVLRGHTDHVTSLAVISDNRVASGSWDKTVRVWNAETGRAIAILRGHRGRVHTLAALPNGHVVSGSADGTIRVWDVVAGEAVATIHGHRGSVKSVAALSNEYVVSGSDDAKVRVWNIRTGRNVRTLEVGTKRVGKLVILSDGRIAFQLSNNAVQVWDRETGHTFITVERNPGCVCALVALADGKIAFGSADDNVWVWDAGAGRVTTTLRGHQGRVEGLTVLPNGHIVSSSSDKTVRVWNIDAERVVATSDTHQGYVKALAVLSDGRIVSGSVDGVIHVWKDTGQIVATLTGHQDAVHALAILPDGNILSGSGDNTIRVWRSEGESAVTTLQGHQSSVRALAVLPKGRVVSGSADNTIRIWEIESGRTIALLEGHQGRVNALAVLPDGRVLSGSDDGTVRVWDMETGRAIATLAGHKGSVNALTVLADGYAVSGSDDSTIQIWDVDKERAISTLRGHRRWVRALTVLPDGRLISGAGDKTVRLWDVSSGRIIASAYGDASIYSLTHVSDRLIVAGDAVGNLWFIDLPP